VDCSEPFTWQAEDFEEQLRRAPHRNKGVCSNAVLAKVLEAVKAATTVSPRDKAAITAALMSFMGVE
jgi:hypothetical protein